MSTTLQVTETRIQGFRAFTVANALLSLTIVPELGGKISSLRDLRTGREWLWTNPSLPYQRLAYGSSYVELADTGGWDECFPSVAASAYPPDSAIHIPDHGELWSQEWSLEFIPDPSTNPSVLQIRTQAHGKALAYTFERVIHLAAESSTLHIDYAVKNLADRPLSFIWSCHPTLAIEPGMRLLLPTGARLRAFVSVPPELLAPDKEYSWPVQITHHGTFQDLSFLPEPGAGFACKLWTQPLDPDQGYAALLARQGSFHFTFDPALVPQVGIWANISAWSGNSQSAPYYNLALEPCIGAQDVLAEAITRYHQYKELPAHETYRWWLDVSLKAENK